MSLKYYRNIKRKSQITDSFRDEFYQLQKKYAQKNEKNEKDTVTWSDFS